MLKIFRSSLPAEEARVRAALASYQHELRDHAKTVAVPAPWPEFDILRDILAAGGEFEVLDDPKTLTADPAPEITESERMRDAIKAHMRENDIKVVRAIVEGDTKRIAEHAALQAELREKLAALGE